jgi:methylmalonyl-CoA mutase
LKSTFEITREMSEKIYVIHHTVTYLRLLIRDDDGLTQEQVAQKLWCFQNNRNSFRKVPVITKSGIDAALIACY